MSHCRIRLTQTFSAYLTFSLNFSSSDSVRASKFCTLFLFHESFTNHLYIRNLLSLESEQSGCLSGNTEIEDVCSGIIRMISPNRVLICQTKVEQIML